jgi:hypothetical protein
VQVIRIRSSSADSHCLVWISRIGLPFVFLRLVVVQDPLIDAEGLGGLGPAGPRAPHASRGGNVEA